MTVARLTLALSLGVSCLSASTVAQSAVQTPPPMPGMSSGASPADRAMMAGMSQMSQAMKGTPLTGNADRDFVAMMLPHHQGAVSMAQVELQYGHDPQMRHLARAIIAAQEKEIMEMRAWQLRHPNP